MSYNINRMGILIYLYELMAILNKNGIKKSYGFDKLLIKYINNKDINYIIINNDFEILVKSYKNNNYKKYLILEYLYSIIIL